MRRRDEEKALQEIVREVRAESPVLPDWEKLESRLARERNRSHRPRPAVSSWVWPKFALVAAAVGGVVALVGVRLSAPPPAAPAVNSEAAPTRKFEPDATGKLAGERLRVGDQVITRASAAIIEHRARATWILAPRSQATLAGIGETLTIRLDSGSLSAEVVPVQRPESFVVEVGQTRVAVHGTRFRVERRSDRVFVDVSEGVVAVGPVSRATPARSWMLRAPSSGDFALDGLSGHVVAAAPASPPRKSRARSARIAKSASPELEPSNGTEVPAAGAEESVSSAEELAETLPPPPAELPNKPSLGDVENGLNAVLNAISACFVQHMPERGDIHVTARTTLKLEIAPDGSIAAQAFEPPLAPSVSKCSRAAAERIRFAPSYEGIRLTRLLELNR
jgi:hypothetical protein